METWYLSLAKTVIPGIAISLLTAFVTVRLSLKRFHAEKWWEKKAEAYGRIIDALHHMKNYCEQKHDEQLTPDDISDEKKKELATQYRAAFKELSRAADIGSFIVSSEAAALLAEYHGRPSLPWNDTDLLDIIEADLKAVSDCLKKFILAAKKDLEIE